MLGIFDSFQRLLRPKRGRSGRITIVELESGPLIGPRVAQVMGYTYLDLRISDEKKLPSTCVISRSLGYKRQPLEDGSLVSVLELMEFVSEGMGPGVESGNHRELEIQLLKMVMKKLVWLRKKSGGTR